MSKEIKGTPKNKRKFLKWPVAVLAVGGAGAVLMLQGDFKAPMVGKGEPLVHTPKAEIRVLDEIEEKEPAIESIPPAIVDITQELQTEEPIEAIPVETIEQEDVIPVEKSAQLETAQLLQATLSLAKQHSEHQLVSAKFHTVMGLVLNPNLTKDEQREWAMLALPLAEILKAEKLVAALDGFASESHKAEKETTLPVWLAPLQNLVSVKRVGIEESSVSIADVRAAYQDYLMNERP